jgi:lipopolysaccharide export system protein LptA
MMYLRAFFIHRVQLFQYLYQRRYYFIQHKVILAVFFLLFAVTGIAQPVFKPDTANKINIQILPPTQLILGSRDSMAEVTRLVGTVHLRQDDNDMTCDSAWFNIGANNVEAFGNVRIVQPGGTQLQSDYLRYIGDKKQAYLRGNVKLEDGQNSLYSEDLTYNLGTKVAVYEHGGTLQSDATTVSSNKGNYNVKTKDARFTEEVIITDPEYNTTSEDLGYNTGTKVVTFFGPSPSTVINDKSVLVTKGGTYDTKNEVARFTKRTSLTSKEQFIEGDRIDYNRHTGYGNATGNVIAIDTLQHTVQWSGFASYNERTRVLLSTLNPVLLQRNGKDSLYIGADTFYSKPDMRGRIVPGIKNSKTGKDTTGTVETPPKRKRAKDVKPNLPPADTATSRSGFSLFGRENNKTITRKPEAEEPMADSTAPRYYIGYHHVRIWSDSLQGRCDSISYSEKDSVMKMIGDPVVWSRRSQITGDTILLFIGDSNKINRLYVPNNAIIVSLAGPDSADLYDQVQGKSLTGYFENNTITEMLVKTDAHSIYYAKDDSGFYIGVNQSESERMRIFFKDEKIQRILFIQEVTQIMTPLDQANLSDMKLSRFKWLEDKRPKSRSELFIAPKPASAVEVKPERRKGNSILARP